MITLFKSIIRVGKFSKFNSGSGSEDKLGKHSIIQGKNTSGKSTLAAILKSLTEGNADYIIGRKTFGSDEDQKVIVRVLDDSGIEKACVFEGDSWNPIDHLPKIKVFDSKYVRQNIHTEESVSESHQQNLESIILGSEARRLADNFEQATEACDHNSKEKAKITSEYNSGLRAKMEMELPEFIELSVDKEVQDKIEAQEGRVAAYKKHGEIKSAISGIDDLLDNWRTGELGQMLAPTLSIGDKVVKNHMDCNMKEKSRATEFLRDGFDMLHSPTGPCPFCSQAIESEGAKSLIRGLAEFFSDNYRQLRGVVKEVEERFFSFDPKQELSVLVKSIVDLGETIDIAEDIDEVAAAHDLVKKEIALKKDDLNHRFEQQVMVGFDDKLEIIRSKLTALRADYEGEFSAEELRIRKDDLRKLIAVKERSSSVWMGNCARYKQLSEQFPLLQKSRGDALEEKNEYAISTFNQYGEAVNSILESLGAEFEIVDLSPKSTIRDKKPLYAIKFESSHPIVINPEPDEIGKPNFGNTLSESDKRLLGFAFFLATVEEDPDKKELIIVLDDPISSFDNDRKLATAKILNKLSASTRQLIVLTHDDAFLRFVNLEMEDVALFEIDHRGTNDTAKIIAMDFDSKYLEDYFKAVTKLENISKGELPATHDDLRRMRDVIENLMMRKYYATLSKLDCGKSVRSYAEALRQEGVYDDSMVKRIDRLLLHFWNHDDSLKSVAKEDFSQGDLVDIAKDFFEVLNSI